MIYCVEDERNIRELLIYTLETTGFKARGFGNGNELMKALKEEIPELILLDIMLPGADGYTILEQLKSMPSVKDVPVIMVTAKEAEFDKVKGLEGGADDYITKPFGMMEFVARVKAVLRRSARQNEDKELHYDELYLTVGRHAVTDRYSDEIHGFLEKTINHIQKMYDALSDKVAFGREDVQHATGLKPTRASMLIKELVKRKILEPVSGYGKGKYKFTGISVERQYGSWTELL